MLLRYETLIQLSFHPRWWNASRIVHVAPDGTASFRPHPGRPLREKSTAVVRALAKALDGALPIIGVGGILSGADAREKLDAGATLVQLYTGLIYRGPALVAECARATAPGT